MRLVNQDQANFASEVRVTTDHFLREVELVNDSLTGTVTAGKKLQIADVVEKAVSVDMVHGFFGKQLAPEMLLHDVAMFQDFVGGRSVACRDSEHGVFAFDSPRDLRKSVLFPADFAHPFVLALLRAKFLFLVDRAASWATRLLKFFSAIFAIRLVPLVGVFAPADSRAWDRTIERIPAEFDSVRGDVRRPHGKRIAAFLAGKFDFVDAGCRSAVDSLVRVHARCTAELAIGFSFARDAEGFFAVLTNSFRDHVVAPLFGNEGTMAWISD
jgi:hypothetical protein